MRRLVRQEVREPVGGARDTADHELPLHQQLLLLHDEGYEEGRREGDGAKGDGNLRKHGEQASVTRTPWID